MTYPSTEELSPSGVPPVVVSLFGSFDIAVNGEPVTIFRSNRARALLVYLLLEQTQPVLRTTLMELLWPEYTPSSARANLRQTLANLRAALAPFDLIQSDYNTVQLRVDPTLLHCDAQHFVALLSAVQAHDHRSPAHCPDCRARLETAMALAQAPFLDQFPTIDSPGFNTWLRTRRRWFAEQIAEAQATLESAVAPTGNLPVALTSFVGRGMELDALATALRDPVYRCVTLLGPGGIGKTRLAQAVGEQLRPAFPDGVWLVALAGIGQPTVSSPTDQLPNPPIHQSTNPPTEALATNHAQFQERVATAIGATLGLAFFGNLPPSAQIAAYLQDKTALLLLDNFEQLQNAADLIPQLLEAAPHLRILVTSRQRLRLQAQRVYHVDGLATPPLSVTGQPDRVPPMEWPSRYASVQLFVDRAATAGFALPRDPATLTTIGALCRLLDGSPWAIELAVAMLEQYAPAAIVATIGTDYRALTGEWLDLPPRLRSAEAVLRTMWRLLTPEEAQLLARCSVFRGGFTDDAAATVVGAEPADLQRLVHKSLLHPVDDARFTLHELVRQSATRQLAAAPTADRIGERHATYYLALLDDASQGMQAPRAYRRRIQPELANVEAAWQWAVAQQDVAALRAALSGLTLFYRLTAYYHAAAATFTAAVEHLHRVLGEQAIPPPAPAATGSDGAGVQRQQQQLLAELLAALCLIYTEGLAQMDEAEPLARDLIAWGHYLADPKLAVDGYYYASLTVFVQGDVVRQRELLEAGLALAEEHGVVQGEAAIRYGLAVHAHLQYRNAEAKEAYERALTVAQQSQDLLLSLLITKEMVTIRRDSGDWGEANAYARRYLREAERLDLPMHVTFATAHLGVLAIYCGDADTAASRLMEAQQRFAAQGEQRFVAETLAFLAQNAQQAGDSATAIGYAQSALALAKSANYYVAQRIAWGHLGAAYLAQGQLAEAHDAYQQGLALAEAAEQPIDLLVAQAERSTVLLAQGEPAAALAQVEPVLSAIETPAEWHQNFYFHTEFLWPCYRVLAVNDDPRAPAILQRAWAAIQARAATIDDPRLRESFLTNLPVNRAIAELVNAGRRMQADQEAS